jgi:hypothetical protein
VASFLTFLGSVGGAEQDLGAQAIERLRHEVARGFIYEGFILELSVETAGEGNR